MGKEINVIVLRNINRYRVADYLDSNLFHKRPAMEKQPILETRATVEERAG